MAREYDLAEILALADGGHYGGNRVISANSAALLLCSAAFLGQHWRWQGENHALTDSEKDVIDAIVSQVTFDLTDEGDFDVGDFVRLDEKISTVDVAGMTLDDFEGTYRYFRLIVRGMRGDRAVATADNLLMYVNGDDTATKYNSIGTSHRGPGVVNQSTIGTSDGVRMIHQIAAEDSDDGCFGYLDCLFYNPQGSTRKKFCNWHGGIAGETSGEMCVTSGSGHMEIADAITSISIAPENSTEFLVDTADSAMPDELVMTLYGMA